MRQSEEMYMKLIAPFEPIGDELLISPEGILAAIPFAALRTRSKYLVELSKTATVHSLLHIEDLDTLSARSKLGKPDRIALATRACRANAILIASDGSGRNDMREELGAGPAAYEAAVPQLAELVGEDVPEAGAAAAGWLGPSILGFA